MSGFSNPRIKRRQRPRKKFTAGNYRKALPFLMLDFDERCAYSMMHVAVAGQRCIEVDHHNPKIKGAKRHAYTNLFPAHRLCNNAKQDQWPTRAQQRRQIRLLNPCNEGDYGHQIFEDPESHELIGTTPAARYHIIVLDLNNPAFIEERARRSQFKAMSSEMYEVPIGGEQAAETIIRSYRKLERHFIPNIPAPPAA